MVFYYLFFVTKKPYSQINLITLPLSFLWIISKVVCMYLKVSEINLEATPPSLYAQATVPVAHESETRWNCILFFIVVLITKSLNFLFLQVY